APAAAAIDIDIDAPAPSAASHPSAARVAPASTAAPAGPSAAVAPPASSDAQLVAGLMKRHRIALIVAGVCVGGAAAAGVWLANRGGAPVAPATGTMEVQPLTVTGNAGLGVLSPDGKFVAYLQRSLAGDSSVWVRQLATQADVALVPPIAGRLYTGLT